MKNKRMLFIIAMLIVLIGGGYYLFKFSPLQSILSDFIVNNGSLGLWILFGIQIVQVIVIPIPANFIIIAGLALFSPISVLWVSALAIVIGSVLNYFIGFKWGYKAIEWAAGKEDSKKYVDIMSKKSKLLLPFMFLFPVFPDDLICMISGAIKIDFWYYLTVVLITRPIGIASICFSFGFIPFTGYWLILWGAIAITIASFMIYVYKNQDKLIEKMSKKKRA